MLAWQLLDVICDTSFIIVLANKPVKGMEELEANTGKINFIVPSIVVQELKKLASSAGIKKEKETRAALNLIQKFQYIALDDGSADDLIMEYASKHRCAVATLDELLKSKLRTNAIRIITLSRNRLRIF